MTEEEMKEHLAWEEGTRQKLKVIEIYMSFPHGCWDKDTRKMYQNWEGIQTYNEWHLRIIRLHDQQRYEQEIDKKYREVCIQPK